MDHPARPFANEERDSICVTCPARLLGAGEFNVAETPRGVRYNRQLDYRVDHEGNPTCVHPLRVGLRPGNYIGGVAVQLLLKPEPTSNKPTSIAIEHMPYSVDNLHPWLVEFINNAPKENLHTTLAQIEEALRERFSDREVVEALRFALSNL